MVERLEERPPPPLFVCRGNNAEARDIGKDMANRRGKLLMEAIVI